MYFIHLQKDTRHTEPKNSDLITKIIFFSIFSYYFRMLFSYTVDSHQVVYLISVDIFYISELVYLVRNGRRYLLGKKNGNLEKFQLKKSPFLNLQILSIFIRVIILESIRQYSVYTDGAC